VKADVGGFGIGSASDLTWNIYSALDYKFGKRTSFDIGYRIYDIDYSKGSGSNEFGLDAQIHGPILGLTYRF
jgi:predicted porin